jgi:hypothetical protein
MTIVMPDRWDPAWGGFSDAGCPTLPSDTQEDPGIRAVWSVTLMESFWIGSPSSLAKSGGAIPGTRCLAPIILLLLESVVSRLLGRNRRPVVPGVQDPDKFHSQGVKSPRHFPYASHNASAPVLHPYGWRTHISNNQSLDTLSIHMIITSLVWTHTTYQTLRVKLILFAIQNTMIGTWSILSTY